MSRIITISIDGRRIKADHEDTLLEAALKNGIDIPNLCYNKHVSHTAACRLCIVRINGRPGVVPACETRLEEGMDVTAFDEELESIRHSILDMTLANHNDDCINCVHDGGCQLQDLAFRYNLGNSERTHPSIWGEIDKGLDYSSQVLDYDASKCIQCGLCVKACYELQGKGVLGLVNRGVSTTISTGSQSWDKSSCDGCGQCVQICPAGALSEKEIYNDRKRFRPKDIEKTVRTTCPYCGVGCQLDIGISKDRILKVNGADSIPNFSKTCVKGRFGLDFVHRKERLTRPLIKKNGCQVEVDWDYAIEHTVKRLSDIKKKHGPDAIGGLSSACCSNEENFVFQKFMRAVIGTNNVDHCARLCHASTVAGLAAAFGSGAMTNSIAELKFADVILVTGSNTTETHPVIATLIKKAVVENQAKLIVVDPRKIDLVRFATVWLRQKSGSDVAWINGIMNVIVEEDLHDSEFIEARTENFESARKIIEKYTPAKVAEISGIPAEKLVEAAKIYGAAKRGSIVYSMGITQHSNGTDNVKSLANLAMLTGNIGRESTGVNPLRGQNNVQGACDMAALPNVLPGYQKLTDSLARRRFENAWGCELSEKNGLTVTEMIDGACDGSMKALYIMGENPMISDPNINHVRESLESLDFLVCQDIFSTETTELADVVFPAASFIEKEGTFTNTERRILPIQEILPPLGEAKADWRVVQDLAIGMGYEMDYHSVRDILHEINSLTPQYAGITHKRINDGEMLQWPCRDIRDPGTKYLHKEKFATVSGKGLFAAVEHEPPRETPDKKYPYVLMTGRVLHHYHTGTMTRKTKVLPQYVPGAYAEMNPADLKKLKLEDGGEVKVVSRRGEITISVKETDRVDVGEIFIPFHFAEAAANLLTNDALDPVAKIPELKVCAVSVNKL